MRTLVFIIPEGDPEYLVIIISQKQALGSDFYVMLLGTRVAKEKKIVRFFKLFFLSQFLGLSRTLMQ